MNVRCLLWRKGIPRSEWLAEITRKTGLPRARVNSFLNGDTDDAALEQHEVAMLAEMVRVSERRQTTFATRATHSTTVTCSVRISGICSTRLAVEGRRRWPEISASTRQPFQDG